MPGQVIHYCDQCQRRISPHEFTDGHAFEVGGIAVCPDCFNKLPANARESLLRGTAKSLQKIDGPERQQGSRRPRRRTSTSADAVRPPTKKSAASLVAIFSAVGYSSLELPARSAAA